MALPLAAMLAPSAIQAGVSIFQLIEANKLKKEMEAQGRPIRETPEELAKALASMEDLATQRELPSQSIIADRMRGSTASGANAISDTSSGGETLGAIAKMYSGEQRGLNDLGVQGENQWLQKQAMLNQVRGQVAQEQDKNFLYNKAQPWDEMAFARSSMLSGGLQNLQGGINSASSAYANKYISDPEFAKGINDWWGGIWNKGGGAGNQTSANFNIAIPDLYAGVPKITNTPYWDK